MIPATPNHQPSLANAASERLTRAKATFTAAAQAAMAGDPDAGHLAQAALAEMNAARAEVKRLQSAPMPVGVWAEAAKLMGGTHG